MVLLLLAFLIGGCSDYGFGHRDDQIETDCFDRFYEAEEVPMDPSCQSFEATGTLVHVIEWFKKDWDFVSGHSHVASQPIAVPLDGDEYPDIVLVSHFQGRTVLRAISGFNGDPLWSIDDMDFQKFGGLAGGDIDGDSKVEIITATTTNRVLAFEHDGTLKWTSERIGGSIPETHAHPAIANMDGAGNPEVIVGSAIFDSNGQKLGQGRFGRGGGTKGSTSFAADLDQDGQQEVIVGNAIYDMNGTEIWYNDLDDGHPAIADFERDGVPEIIVSSNGTIRVQESADGAVRWSVTLNGNASGPPTIADFDGDGFPEIGVASSNRYTVLQENGDILWEKDVVDPSGYLSASAFDFEGDGLPELLFLDEKRVRIFHGPTGEQKVESPEHSSPTEMEYAIIIDTDNDGEAEIVSPAMPEDGRVNGPNSGIITFGAIDDSWRPARRIWNQHAYSITNVNDDGTIPDTPAANWETFNNFRAGDLNAITGLVLPDLTAEILDLCEFECDAGRMAVWVKVGNEGMADIKGEITVQMLANTADGLELLDEEVLAGGVPVGQSLAAIKLVSEEFTNMVLEDILIRVDGGNEAENGGRYVECHEDNNEEWWGTQVCGP